MKMTGNAQDIHNEYINSKEWQDISAARIAGKKCEVCGLRPATKDHHLTYKRLGHEKFEDLQAVCGPCNMQAHGLSDNPRVIWARRYNSQREAVLSEITSLKSRKPGNKMKEKRRQKRLSKLYDPYQR